MSTAPVPAVEITAEKPLSQLERILKIFYAPSITFSDLKRGSAWWLAFIVMSLASLPYVYMVDKKIGFEQAMQNEMRLAPKQEQRLESTPEPQRSQQWNLIVTSTKVTAYASPVIMLLGALLLALIFMATFNFGFGEKLAYGRCLAVVIYSSLPGLISGVLALISLFAGVDPGGFIMENPVASNLGLFFDPLQSPVLYRFASHFDIFSIWSMILLGIGFSCIANKLKKSTAITVVFSWWALYVLLGLAKNALTA